MWCPICDKVELERKKMNWQEEFETVVRSIGSATYGKDRWFHIEQDLWYDRWDGKHINTFTLQMRMWDAIVEEEIGKETE